VWDRTYGSLLQFRRLYDNSYLDSMLWGESGADVGPPQLHWILQHKLGILKLDLQVDLIIQLISDVSCCICT
jgi:hypothetical protein